MADIIGFPFGSRPGDAYPCDVEPPCEGNGEPDPIKHPAHYNQGTVETIDIIEFIISAYPNQAIAYNVGAALKYICRAPFKHPTISDDLKKAQWHINRAVTKLG